MDPFTFLPTEVCDSILQYLSGNEILEASRVSKTWNSIIGASATAMQKIKLNLFWLRGPHCFDDDVLNILIESRRKYQNVIMKFQSLHTDCFRKILVSNHGQWKHVSLERLVFETSDEFIGMIKVFEKSVEELNLDNIFIKQIDDSIPFNLPLLRKLRLTEVEAFKGSVNNLFAKCKNLNEFWITSSDSSEETLTSVKSILESNKKIKHLEITSDIINKIMESDPTFEFKVNTVAASNYNHFRPQWNHTKFIKNQFQNIRKISFDEITCIDTIKLLYKMPNLRTLNLGDIDTLSMALDNQHLNVNKAIVELRYRDLEKNFQLMKCFIDASPNLQNVEMFSLTQEMMEHLSAGAKHLKVLKLRTINTTDMTARDLFPNLRHLCVEIISSNFEDQIVAIPVDEANPFVKLLKATRNYVILD